MSSFLQGLQFLSVIPFPQKMKPATDSVTDLEKLGKSTAFFPLIGAFFGLILVGINVVLIRFLPNSVTNVFLIIVLILISGGLHLDGFIDTVDGLFCGKDRDKSLEIMRDSRVGAHGVSAVVCLLLLKFALLDSFAQGFKWKALLLMPALGQWAMVYAIALYPYARVEEGVGKLFAEKTGMKELIVASLTVLFLSFVVLGISSLGILAGLVISTFLLARFVYARIRGFTGDTYGALAEITEVWVLLLMLIMGTTI